MNLNDFAASHVRTIVPIVVGWLIAFALKHGLNISLYQGLVTSIVTAVYYSAARAAEHYISPKFGWLLGLAKKPVYVTPVTSVTP